MKKTAQLFFSAIIFLFIRPCFAEMAQEITISGYQQPGTPVTNSPIKNPSPAPTKKMEVSIPATAKELQQIIASVNLKDWASFASYLWTCTPSYFSLPMYNAKNNIQTAFTQFSQNKKILTKKRATEIADKIGQPLEYRIPGLQGISCRVNILVSNIEKPYALKCAFIMLDARSLSRFANVVADNDGKDEFLSKDTLSAIQTLLDNNCTQMSPNTNLTY